jgi:hypothetical protein
VAAKGWILFLLPAAIISLFAGCGSNANVQNPPPPPPASKIAIAFQHEPSGSLAVSFSENLTAIVSNDPNNYGVDWSLTCQNPPNCGSLSVPHTASGVATTYTAPSSISTSTMSVEIVAFATADHYQNVVAPVAIYTFDSGIKGTYVLQAQGVDSSFNPYQFVGVIVLDGDGNITSGEQTVNFVDPTSGTLITKSDTNLTGSYFLGSDGRGTITINPNNDTDIGAESFSFVFLSNSTASPTVLSKALIAALSTSTLTISATGTMDLQTSTVAAPSGGYAFAVSGVEISKMFPLALGGVLNIDSPDTISGNGSVSDEILDFKVTSSVAVSGALTSPDSFGQFTMNLTGSFSPKNPTAKIQFTGYIVDDTHINLIESDNGSGTGFGSTSGLAIGQGNATGTFADNASFSGTYVFGLSGVDLSNENIEPSTLTAAGVFTADGSGNLTNGFTDTFLLLNAVQGTSTQPQTGAQISGSFGGTYSVDSSGTGRASLTFNNLNPAPRFGYQPIIFFYLTGNGNPPLVLQGGDTHYPLVGTGIAYPQTTPLTFSGDYGFSFTQQNGNENDGTAQMDANPAAIPAALSGLADINLGFGPNPDQPFTGIFSTPASNGLFPGTLVGTNNDILSSVVFTPQIAVDYYIIDPSHGFFIETDLVTQGAQQNGQISMGYYAERTPVCDGCP